jgi:hypothetical protein
LASTFDQDFKFIPDLRECEKDFQRLKDTKVEGHYYGSDIILAPIGLKEIFEGQARFCQLQYLHFGSGGKLDFDSFRASEMLSGVYVQAFKLFLEYTESEWPESVRDPLVNLFLLVCDVSINPSDGFPFAVTYFESFIEDASPGFRFLFLSRMIANKFPKFKSHIQNYSGSEYTDVSEELFKALLYRSPLEASREVVKWSQECPALIELRKQGESFSFSDANLPVRVVFERFINLSEDKIKTPEFFCWPGAWAAGERCSDQLLELFFKHQALFSGEVNGDIHLREFPDKEESLVQQTFNAFFIWNITYDLSRQWIVEEGRFNYFFFWLSNKYTLDEYRSWARHHFKAVYGVDPEDFNIL